MNDVLNEISKMKQQVAMVLLQDREVVNLISDRTDLKLPAKSLQYVNVYPWAHVPDATEKAKVFVTYDVRCEGINNPAVKHYRLTIFVFAHDNMLRLDNEEGERLGVEDRGVRTDVLAAKIDKALNGKNGFGITRLEIEDERPLTFSEHFHGRQLTYVLHGWNRTGGQLA